MFHSRGVKRKRRFTRTHLCQEPSVPWLFIGIPTLSAVMILKADRSSSSDFCATI